MSTVDPNKIEVNNIPHSGDLGLEKPAEEQLVSLAEDARNLQTPQTSESIDAFHTVAPSTDTHELRAQGANPNVRRRISPKTLAIGGTAVAAGVVLVVAALLPKGNPNPVVIPDGAESSNSSTPNPSETAKPTDVILPGYHYAGTPTFELAPLPENLVKYEKMPFDQYLQLPAQERATTYGAYLVQNIYAYAARFQEDSGEAHDTLNKITPDSKAADLVQFSQYVAKYGLSFQSKEDPTKVDVDKALKLYASFFYTSSEYKNNVFDDLKTYLEANPEFIDVDYAYTSQQFSGQGAMNIISEGTRLSTQDFNGNVTPQVEGFHYNFANQAAETFSTSVLYAGTDPLTGEPATYPVSSGRDTNI